MQEQGSLVLNWHYMTSLTVTDRTILVDSKLQQQNMVSYQNSSVIHSWLLNIVADLDETHNLRKIKSEVDY